MFIGKEFTNFVKFMIPKSGLFDHTPFEKFMSDNLHVKTFEELSIPLFVVASDLDHGRSVVFAKGDLPRAILASCCVPVVFNPVVIEGVHYVDGGIFRNFPVTPIRHLCETVIGINVSPLMSPEYKQNILQIAQRAYHFMFKANTFDDKRKCDILVEMEEAQQFSTFDLVNIDKIFQLGYNDMVSALEEKYGMKRVKEPQPINLAYKSNELQKEIEYGERCAVEDVNKKARRNSSRKGEISEARPGKFTEVSGKFSDVKEKVRSSSIVKKFIN